MTVSGQGLQWVEPDWPVPPTVRAVSTLRSGGVSQPPFESLNLARHVGDDPRSVSENRRRLSQALQLPDEPFWLQQVHGKQVARLVAGQVTPTADASFTHEVGKICVVMTADCLPVLFCTRNGDRVAAAHAGWRGLVGGVLEATIKSLDCPPSRLLAWLGPAISSKSFEVGDEVYDAFATRNASNASCFVRNDNQRWQADLQGLARNELQRLGVLNIFNEAACTVNDVSRFFSYRRDGRTGRMASMIWLQAQ